VASEFTEADPWWKNLEEAGFDRSKPSVWLCEGLFMYLSIPDTIRVISKVGELSSEGS